MTAIVAMLVLVVIVLAALLRIGQDDKHIDLRKPARNELRRFGAVRYSTTPARSPITTALTGWPYSPVTRLPLR